MLKSILVLSLTLITNVSQAFDFNSCHSGTNCQGTEDEVFTYNCFGSGSEKADLLLIKTENEGVYSLLGNSNYMRKAFDNFKSKQIPGLTGSVADVNFKENTPFCSEKEVCLSVKMQMVAGENLMFLLSLDGHSHGTISYVCTTNRF